MVIKSNGIGHMTLTISGLSRWSVSKSLGKEGTILVHRVYSLHTVSIRLSLFVPLFYFFLAEEGKGKEYKDIFPIEYTYSNISDICT